MNDDNEEIKLLNSAPIAAATQPQPQPNCYWAEMALCLVVSIFHLSSFFLFVTFLAQLNPSPNSMAIAGASGSADCEGEGEGEGDGDGEGYGEGEGEGGGAGEWGDEGGG